MCPLSMTDRPQLPVTGRRRRRANTRAATAAGRHCHLHAGRLHRCWCGASDAVRWWPSDRPRCCCAAVCPQSRRRRRRRRCWPTTWCLPPRRLQQNVNIDYFDWRTMRALWRLHASSAVRATGSINAKCTFHVRSQCHLRCTSRVQYLVNLVDVYWAD